MIPSVESEEYRIEALADAHDRAAFSCGVEALDTYLHRQAKQDSDRRTAAVFVLTNDGVKVGGFYTLSAFSLIGAELPEKLAKKLPSRSPIGVTLLGRMAVAQELRGMRLGEYLLTHALERAWSVAKQVASYAVVVDAKPESRAFYLRYGFLPLLSQPNRLYLLMKTIEQSIGT